MLPDPLPGSVLDVVRLVKDEHRAADVDVHGCPHHRIHQVAAATSAANVLTTLDYISL